MYTQLQVVLYRDVVGRKILFALSTTEAKYISTTKSSEEAIWLARVCDEFGLLEKALMLGCDSQSAIYLAKNAIFHALIKHLTHSHPQHSANNLNPK